MNYELDGVKTQFNDMQSVLKKNDRELKDYQNQLEERKQKVKLDEIKKAYEQTKKVAAGYSTENRRDYVREDENGEIVLITEEDDMVSRDGEPNPSEYDISELIADNRILLDRVDQMLDGGDDTGGFSTRRSME